RPWRLELLLSGQVCPAVGRTGIVAGDSGILLNNQMDDFSAKPGVPNVYGLVGGEANAVEPKKRPLSSMSPTIVVKDGKTWLVTCRPSSARRRRVV
ncbi:gamma-glutamyltransferase, partial [Klebsiella pneumoniae]|uniref:gamma-glutamyltransferase n=1 Tax=Klebsiella pneumoniae TaxID=573 RepID=UPI00210E90F8